mgnify:CR=1 FL=1
MRILGLSFGFHDAGACMLNGNEIEFASHSERYSKVKNDPWLNHELINAALEKGKPDVIALHEKAWAKKLRNLTARNWSALKEPTQREWIEKFYPQLKDIPIVDYWHHETHAAAGVLTSEYEDCAVMVIDAIGEFDTASIWHATPHGMKKIWSLKYPSSLGLFYSAITHRCGLKPNEEEYILMGMSAYGDPDRYYEQMKPLLEKNLHRGCRWWLPGEQGQQDTFDMAAAAQKIYEEEFEELVYKTRKMLPHNKSLVIMGGCALNCVANNIALKYFDDVWIMPAPGDSGSSLGAILAETETHINWRGPYLGHNIEGDYPVGKLMNELLQGNMVGVANGRAEFGPRALGNRSLLADPRGTKVKDQVNAIKRRQEFRPFAPAILSEFAEEYFDGITNPYMQYVSKAKHEYNSVIHVDGTSRVQTVEPDNPSILRPILEEYYEKTGVPMLLNTSLNLAGEPLVNTKEEACELLNNSKLDAIYFVDDRKILYRKNIKITLHMEFSLRTSN